jgi:uncharacterized protein
MDAGRPSMDAKSASTAGNPLGRVLSVNGSHASVGILATDGINFSEVRTTVGRLLRIQSGKSVVIGVITNVSLQTIPAAREQGYYATADVDLMGEIEAGAVARYRKGVSEYPTIGDAANHLERNELQIVYGGSNANTIQIGHLQHDSAVNAYVHVNETLSKHFAVLGSTGVGKSSAVTLMLQKIMETQASLRVLMIDVHNEYAQCFGKHAQVLNPRNLKLPFWLFNFEEMLDVIFSGRPGVEDEVEILFETIPLAKAHYLQYRSAADRPSIKRADQKRTGFTVDTPVPYRIADLISLIDERLGRLENRSSRLTYHRLITRIETISRDPRYTFMFDNANVGGDVMAEVLSQVFRLPSNGVPMTIIQLAGFPSEVVDAVVSVVCRMAFDFGLWSDGMDPLLLVCEEAHLYASADHSIGFGPTRRAISRIAKEGRKYGVFLGLVTQRPAELDPTIISQCSTIFAMRMTNDRDQALLRSAISDAGSNLLAFLPSLGIGEILAFGEGVALPTRIKVDELPAGLLHRRGGGNFLQAGRQTNVDLNFIAAVIDRWRGATMSLKPRQEEMTQISLPAGDDPVPLQPAAPVADSDPFKIAAKLDAARPEAAAAQRDPHKVPGLPQR